ncbi:MAG: TIM barrel protein [Verrucomicrobiota bacterium]|jgi:sugar phosphate isomerase/epimerase
MKLHTRRAFIQHSFAVAATTALFESGALLPGQGRASESKLQSIRLGGPAFASADDPEALALAHRKLGYRAAYCPDVSLKDSEKIRACADAFARHDVVIAEVGRWVNLLEADPDKRRQNLQTVTDGLALAEAIGALCCVDIAGSFSPASWFGPHPDNLSHKHFDAIVENARTIIDAVKPKRARFTYEVMGWALPDSPDSYLKLIQAIDRKAFGVHLDPCNLINSPDKFYHNTALLNQCFDKLGRWLVSCHAKDLTWDVEMNLHFREVIPGQGALDYTTYLQRLARLPQNPPLMLEHLASAQEYATARQHVLEVGRQAGLSFD